MKKRLSESAAAFGMGQVLINNRSDMGDTNDDDSEDESCDKKLGVKRLLRRSNDIAENNDESARTIYTRENLDSAVSGRRNTLRDVQPDFTETNLGVVGFRSSNDFNFRLTEGQSRRGLMADCESECSAIFDFLFVGGAHIARSWKTLEERKITRIVNCSAAVVDNHFLNDPKMKYLSLNMVDGRQDDISWFLGDVLQFIMSGRKAGENILIHCERGVSRSCSFAIAYHIWTTGGTWKDAFDYVKSKRACCAPNTAFTCNLIEISECLKAEWRNEMCAMFRCAAHLLPHDPNTPALKLCRNKNTRKCIHPRSSILDPRGVYVIKIPEKRPDVGASRTEKSDREKGGDEAAVSGPAYTTTDASRVAEPPMLYLWIGSLASPITVAIAADLALNLVGVFTYAQLIKHVHMGEEPQEFFTYVTQDGPFSPRDNNDVDIYSDLFVPRTYDNSHSTFSRSDSLVGRSGKGEKHFQGEKHYPLGRFMGASSPEHLSLSDRSRDKRVDLNCMGLKINLQGIMPNTGAHTAHANKYSDADTGHSQEARSQLEKVSARSFHSTDSNDSYNDSDMFYNVGTSRSGFSEGSSNPVTPRSEGNYTHAETEDKALSVLEELELVSGEASPLTPRAGGPKRFIFPAVEDQALVSGSRKEQGHSSVTSSSPSFPPFPPPPPLKSAVRPAVSVPALKMISYADQKESPSQTAPHAPSPRNIDYAEYQRAFRSTNNASLSSLLGNIGQREKDHRAPNVEISPLRKESTQTSATVSSIHSGLTSAYQSGKGSRVQSRESSFSSILIRDHSQQFMFGMRETSQSYLLARDPSLSSLFPKEHSNSSLPCGKEPSFSRMGSRELSASQLSGKELYASQMSGKDPYASHTGKEPFSSQMNGKEPYPSQVSGRDSNASQSGKDPSSSSSMPSGAEPYSQLTAMDSSPDSESSMRPLSRRFEGFPPSPPTSIRKPSILSSTSMDGILSTISSSSSSTTSHVNSMHATSVISSCSSGNVPTFTSVFSFFKSGSSGSKGSSSISGHIPTFVSVSSPVSSSYSNGNNSSSSSSSTATHCTYSNSSILSSSNLSTSTLGSTSATAPSFFNSSVPSVVQSALNSSSSQGTIANTNTSSVTMLGVMNGNSAINSLLNSSMSSQASTNSSNSPRCTGSPRSSNPNASPRFSLATATAILMGIGAGVRPSTPRKHNSTASSPRGILTPSSSSSHSVATHGSKLSGGGCGLGENDYDDGSDPRDQFYRERRKEKLEAKTASLKKEKERNPPPPSNTPTSFDSLSPSVQIRKLSAVPRVKVSSNTATVRSGISPTHGSCTPNTATKLAMSAELLLMKIQQSANTETVTDPCAARENCMNSVAQELTSQLYGIGAVPPGTGSGTGVGMGVNMDMERTMSEEINQVSRFSSHSEKENMLCSRMGSADDRAITEQLMGNRMSSVDDYRHNSDILMLSQRSSANDSMFHFSRQGSINDSHSIFTRGNSVNDTQLQMARQSLPAGEDRTFAPPLHESMSPMSPKKEFSLSFSNITSPRNKMLHLSTTMSPIPSASNTPTSRTVEGNRDSIRERERARGKSPSSLGSEPNSRKHSISSLPPLSPTFDFGSRAFRLPIDINLVRAPDTPLTSERNEAGALDAAASLCLSGRIYDMASRSSRSREMSRRSSSSAVMMNGSHSDRNSTRDKHTDPSGIDLQHTIGRTGSVYATEFSPRGMTNKEQRGPRLYQVAPVPLKRIKSAADLKYTWDGLGIYDEEDLNEDELLLLTCPQSPHYLWMGSDFRLPYAPGIGTNVSVFTGRGAPSSVSSPSLSASASSASSAFNSLISSADGSSRNSSDNLAAMMPTHASEHPSEKTTSADVLMWVTYAVARGEITVGEFPDGSFANPGTVEVIISGEETEEFWMAFNEEY